MLLNVGQSVRDDKGNVYSLAEVIGSGGFGYVFKAYRKYDNAIFAVKTSFPSFGDPSTALSFKNEITSAIKISGDHVIRYEYIHDGDTFPEYPPYIIMEYANGGTLTDLLKTRKQIGKPYSNDELRLFINN